MANAAFVLVKILPSLDLVETVVRDTISAFPAPYSTGYVTKEDEAVTVTWEIGTLRVTHGVRCDEKNRERAALRIRHPGANDLSPALFALQHALGVALNGELADEADDEIIPAAPAYPPPQLPPLPWEPTVVRTEFYRPPAR